MSLEVHITKKLGNFTLRADLSSNGNCCGILGESGCGKSMFLKCIAGIETPDSGSIVLNGRILYDSEKKINLPPQKRGVGYLFQNYALFPSMTVAQNIASGINQGRFFLSRKEKEKAEATVKLQIERCRLQGLEDQYPSQLSGGQQQRTALARILAVNPSIIMLDEPFSALDSHLKDAMQKEMRDIIRNYPGNVLIVSHSRDELYRLCDFLYIMNAGAFIQNGPIREVFQAPDSIQAAILTGCKNITPIKRIHEHLLSAPRWGITLSPKQPVSETVTHVAIRAHYFRLSADSRSDSDFQPDIGLQNTFRAQIVQIEEQPFEYDYYLKTKASTEAFIWKIHKSPESTFHEGDEVTLHILPEDVMLLHG
ncbi:MAG: ATP-binding cassette domain-containing protein [Lachnospiraceae bacterium]|nr:ATP-binding cassette domain-containing protein [Lachnospiraceae bacterium]